jgi:NAD(P)-dependent dehydrogenase (short-subunit alcohol dehydrogenase family)
MKTVKRSYPTPPQPKQQQSKQPGIESEMQPQPQKENPAYTGSGKLQNKIAIITGGDSGIGRAVAIAFAKEGADIMIAYLNEHEDAKKTKQLVEEKGKRCELIAGDIGNENFCNQIVQETLNKFNQIDIIINNAAEQHEQKDLKDISAEQLEKTFRTNIFSMFYLTKAALPHLQEDAAIINSTSVTAYKGSAELLDYASTKGAIVAFTRSLSQSLIQRKIRVNAVAPGPVWTPLIPASFDREKVSKFGEQVPLKRAGQPEEIAPSYVFLASALDSSYMTGQVLHPNGGVIVNS